MDRNNSKTHTVNILQWNAQSLRPKLTEFELLLNQEKIHIAIVSETWLDPNSYLRISGYQIYRLDRSDGYGGVAVIIHWSIKAQQQQLRVNNAGIELLHVKLFNCGNVENIVSVYCPPTVNSSFQDWYEIFAKFPNKTLIAGDFNGHHSSWSCKNNTRGTQIFDALFESNLIILNDGSNTRIKIANGLSQKSSPDVSMASEDIVMKFDWNIINENLGSDHLMIKMKMELILTPFTTKFKRNFKEADWLKYKENIDLQFRNFVLPLDNQEAYDSFVNFINLAADKAIPGTKNFECPLDPSKFVPKSYWSVGLSHLVGKRRLALAKFRKNPTPNNLESLMNKVGDAQRETRHSKFKSWGRFCDSFDYETSYTGMWSRMKWLKGYRTTKCVVSRNISEPMLCGLAPDFVTTSPPVFSSTNKQLDILVSVQELNNCIKKSDTAPGIDGVTYSMISNLSESGKRSLVELYNRFLLDSFVPVQWRNIKIVPIPKPGRDLTSCNGYRPIALLSCICKIFHTIIARRLEWFFEKNEYFANETVGFRRSRSCYDNLVRLISRIQIGFTVGNPTVGCFVDIDNAYNNIDVPSLLIILDKSDVGSSLCNYLWQFLSNRVLFVEIEGNKELSRTTGMGLAQGDPLSPLLFNVATNKICKYIKNVYISQYADDFVMYSSNKNINIAYNNVQVALEAFSNLVDELGLKISINKSKICIFYRRKPRDDFVGTNNYSIQHVNSIKYLGMWLDSSLKWGKHIIELKDKILKFLNIFKILAGSKWGVHPKHLRLLYISLIRSRLDYGSFFYANSSKSNLDKLDRIQNQCMRIIGGFIKTTPIHAMESELCLQPLQIRRKYLAGKFWLKCKSFFNNVSLNVIRDLNSSCDSLYWRKKKLPLLISIHRSLRHYSIAAEKKLPMYSLLIWISSLDITKNISSSIEGVSGNKLSWNKSELYNQCIKFLDIKYASFNKLYTDGSKNEFGGGAAVFDPQRNITLKFKSHLNISIMHIELIAIYQSLLYILSDDKKKYVILSDSKSALDHLARLTSLSRGYPIAYDILECICRIEAESKIIIIQWIPSHIGITGNEAVDKAAKEAIHEGVPSACVPVYSEILSEVKKLCRQDWQEYFDERSRYKGIWYNTVISGLPLYPWFYASKMKREYIVSLFRLRTGHILCNKFKFLMGVSNTEQCALCNKIDDVYHLLMECVRGELLRPHGLRSYNVGACNSVLADPLSTDALQLAKINR